MLLHCVTLNTKQIESERKTDFFERTRHAKARMKSSVASFVCLSLSDSLCSDHFCENRSN